MDLINICYHLFHNIKHDLILNISFKVQRNFTITVDILGSEISDIIHFRGKTTQGFSQLSREQDWVQPTRK